MFTKNKLFTKKEETPDMSQDTTLAQMQEQLASVEAQLSEAQGAVVELAQAKEQLAQMQEMVATTEASLTEAKAALEAVAQEKEQMKADARKEKLAAVLSAEQVEGVFPALAGLEDAAFEAVLNSYTVSAKATEQSEMFQEVGSTASTEAEEVVEEDATTRLLKQRYGQ